MPMTTNDIRILALLTGIGPEFLSRPESELLFMVYHQCSHLYLQGKFKAFYDSLPRDIAVPFMVDRRTLDWMLTNKCHFIVGGGKTSIVHQVADQLGLPIIDLMGDDAPLGDLIDDTQAAMLEAAKLLRKHGLDK
jgi:hypothetical protein